MQNIIKTVLGLGMFAAIHATPISFIDVVGGNSGLIAQNTPSQSYTYVHDLTDNGFFSSTDHVLNADLWIVLADDLDKSQEKVKVSFDNTVAGSSIPVDLLGIYSFNVNTSLLQADGKLKVTLDAVAGDFYFLGSVLQVSADRSVNVASAAVPEPTTMALMGLGVLALGFAARRKKA